MAAIAMEPRHGDTETDYRPIKSLKTPEYFFLYLGSSSREIRSRAVCNTPSSPVSS